MKLRNLAVVLFKLQHQIWVLSYIQILVLACIDITGEGENFVGYDKKMRNIHGTYCVPEFRGQNVIQDLLEHVIRTLKTEGYELLGVDHESTNPTANRFWRKYFTDYTCSVLRKIF